MEYILNNWGDILSVASSVIAASSVVVRLTPTETDNKIFAVVLKVFDFIALNNKPSKLNK